MKFPFFASFIIFVLVLARIFRKQRRIQQNQEDAFWERERLANNTRRKSLDHLDYIHIPMDRLPLGLMTQDETVADCLNTLETLSSAKIVNLTGLTNTDLKLEYGAANITVLSEYDQNYTILVRTLQKWADVLWDAGFQKEAVSIMEFAVETHTDISHTYYRLAEYYQSHGEASRIRSLLETAETLHSANKNAIVRTLQKSYL